MGIKMRKKKGNGLVPFLKLNNYEAQRRKDQDGLLYNKALVIAVPHMTRIEFPASVSSLG